jgi:hypothetical protein
MIPEEQGKVRGYGNVKVKLMCQPSPTGARLEKKNAGEDFRRAGWGNRIDKGRGRETSTGSIFIPQVSVAHVSTPLYLDISETDTLRESSLSLQLFHYGLIEDAGLAPILANMPWQNLIKSYRGGYPPVLHCSSRIKNQRMHMHYIRPNYSLARTCPDAVLRF